MARKRITEYKAKTLLYPHLKIPLQGAGLSSKKNIDSIKPEKLYVIKVDQGVKGRMKKGLVKVKVKKEEIQDFISQMEKKGYVHLFAEEFVEHSSIEEKFLSIERERDGLIVFYSNTGGIDVEKNVDRMQKTILTTENKEKKTAEITEYLDISKDFLETIFYAFEKYYFSFLEINPLVVKGKKIFILDLAVEVDSTAEFFVQGAWSRADFIDVFSQKKTVEEKNITELANQSQAAFTLEMLNSNGSIFLLLSGGGASLVVADEVYNLSHGKELANYGEYSGNPNAEETYIYTKNILSLLLKSDTPKKVLIIGGGVANFTDIRVTFKGLVKALDEVKEKLKEQKIGIFLRRGGPHQKEGLQMLKDFLKKNNIEGEVYGPQLMLTDIVKKGVSFLEK